jgi:hypothetical protein
MKLAKLKQYTHSAEFVVLARIHAKMLGIQADLSKTFQRKDTMVGDISAEIETMKGEMYKYADMSSTVAVRTHGFLHCFLRLTPGMWW